MPLHLTYPQHIIIKRQRVHYCHNDLHGAVLNRHQFANLHDIIHTPLNLKSYPLGGGAWLLQHARQHTIQTRYGFFVFYFKSWKKYIKQVHWRIRNILHNGKRERCEYDANNEGYNSNRSRRLTSRAWRKTTSGTTRNACDAYVRRKKYSNVSEWNNSNPRPRFSEPRQPHVSRTEELDSSTNLSDEDIKSGDECSIEEEAMSIENSTQ